MLIIQDKIDWVVFDADNTLWDLEVLYHDARSKFCKYMAKLGFNEIEIANFQQERDVQLFAYHQRRPIRFPQSFLDTLLFHYPIATDKQKKDVWEIASEVFLLQAMPYKRIEEAIKLLTPIAKIGIFTAGYQSVQMKRLHDFPYLNLIGSQYEIVDDKNIKNFQNLVMKWNIDVNKSWMVGDSLKSDILPAQSVGLNTIWVQTNNWVSIETEGINFSLINTLKAESTYDAVLLILKWYQQ